MYFRFVPGIKQELFFIQLMLTTYIPKHSQVHADSEYVSYVEETIRQSSLSVTNKYIYRHSNLLLVQIPYINSGQKNETIQHTN